MAADRRRPKEATFTTNIEELSAKKSPERRQVALKIQVLSIFPEMIDAGTQFGLVRRAVALGRVEIETRSLRAHAVNAHGQVDDTPYGGGSGMILRPEPAFAAVREAKERDPSAKVVLFSPRGKRLTQEWLRSQAASGHGLILLCNRYEGVDERITESLVDEELSMGDYVLMGGELPALTLIEGVARLLPEVLGNPESSDKESFQDCLLEHPHYTKPAEFEGQGVPPALLSGNHAGIEEWRRARQVEETLTRRPDLLAGLPRPAGEVSVVLVHYPVKNKQKQIVTTSITNIDLHDIARSARTFGLARFYVVHPTRLMRRLVQKIMDHWDHGAGKDYNPNRSDALSTIRILPAIEDVVRDIEARTGRLPKLLFTSARNEAPPVTFLEMRARLRVDPGPFLLMLGTGWGLAPELLEQASYCIEPINGPTDYNHLSVRAAAAIMFDRLLGPYTPTPP